VAQAAEECTKLINKNSPEALLKYLNTLPDEIKLNQIIDKDGYSLLHMAAFQNRTKIVEALLERAKDVLYQYEVAEWVNQKTTKDEFTALHYASFKGNI